MKMRPGPKRKYDPDLIKSLLKEFKPSEVAEKIGVSRQRISQLRRQYFPSAEYLEHRDKCFVEKYGMTEDTLNTVRKECQQRKLADPLDCFFRQKAVAKIRKIAWEFKFSEWWSVWKDHYHLRGPGPYHLVMCRRRDSGPYSVENVFLDTGIANLEAAWSAKYGGPPNPKHYPLTCMENQAQNNENPSKTTPVDSAALPRVAFARQKLYSLDDAWALHMQQRALETD